MPKDPLPNFSLYKTRAQRLEQRWQKLCKRYLPLTTQDSIWRYHRISHQELTQGWKLHISATVLNACQVLERVAPFLIAHSVHFKAPRSLNELIRINSGLFYGYSQIGKIITVYPRTPEDAVSLARELHKMTRRMVAPSVPFDLRYSAASNVYYRFGGFRHLEIEDAEGQRTLAIEDIEGNLVPDERLSEKAKPDWVSDPFEGQRPRSKSRKAPHPLAKSFRAFRALVQRGKGGVYQAVDLRTHPPRLCLLKEGRKNGELTWDGRDGVWRVRNEERVLSMLLASGVDAPRIYSSFESEGNYYLVTEFIKGESLQNLLFKLQRRMSLSRVLRYGIQFADIFRQIHAAGWVWRDCKPVNILVTPEGRLRPLDFEGACPVNQPDPMFWGTPGFTPPDWRDFNPQTCLQDDLYALGSMLYLLLTGRVPEVIEPLPIEKLRQNVPSNVRELVMRLLSRSPALRPSAETVGRELKAALSFYESENTARRQATIRQTNRRNIFRRRNRKGVEQNARRRRPNALMIPMAATEG